MMGYVKKSLELSALCVAMICLQNSAFALENLQKLDDDALADATGEGIAFALNDFSFQLNGADDTEGTGYVRYIPVGAQSKIIDDHNNAIANANGTDAQKSRAKYDTDIGKADMYLYGLAISGNDGDANTQFSENTVNSGSYVNPWMIKATTENYANFAGTVKALSYLLIEAPTFDYEADPYDLKIGLWADALVRDPALEEGNSAQFQLNGATRSGTTYKDIDSDGDLDSVTVSNQIRENRLRLQMIANGFSLNGSNIKVFQTLDGATNTGGLSTAYNNTLGLAGTIRLNSGDSTSLKMTSPVNGTEVNNPRQDSGWQTIHAGTSTTISTDTNATGCGNTSSGTAFSTASGCRFIVQNRIYTDSKSRSTTWTLPSDINDHVLRISTRELQDDNANLITTPALGGASPNFADSEGVYLYQPNINLVLGTPWQPLTLGVAEDNRNIVMELSRIPNVANVYNEIYADYFGTNPELKGATCSIYWCGDSSKNATHSSISIGTTEAYGTAGSGTLTAYKGIDAIGVSFGALGNTGTSTSYADTKLVRYKQRDLAINNQAWVQERQCSLFGANCSVQKYGTSYQWTYNNNGTWQVWNPVSTPTNAPSCSSFGTCTTYSTPNIDKVYSNSNNRNWTEATSPATWQTVANAEVNGLIGAQNGVTGVTSVPVSNIAPTPPVSSSFNNFGSAVADGLLIQHWKFTTKGL